MAGQEHVRGHRHRDGDLVHVAGGHELRLREVIAVAKPQDAVAQVDGAANLRAGALLTCHATLPYGPHPDFGPAVCAGFWARHRNNVLAGRLTQLLLGTIRIPPPDHDNDHRQEAPKLHQPCRTSPGRSQPDSATPRGRRIRLLFTSDPHTRLQPGALGTVTGTDDLGTLQVQWDDGSRLGLLPDQDEFEILGQAPPGTSGLS